MRIGLGIGITNLRNGAFPPGLSYAGSQTEDTADFRIGPSLIVEQSTWAVTLDLPPEQIISTDAESVTLEA